MSSRLAHRSVGSSEVSWLVFTLVVSDLGHMKGLG
jgi:hypothetical protein